MSNEVLPLVFAVIIAITHYQTGIMRLKKRHFSNKILSFSAGISITYVLLELFPTFTEVALTISKLLFVSILLGFILHHLIEKEIYKHNRDHDLVKLLSLEENIFSFVYHVILGIVLFTLAKENVLQGILAFIPILTFTLVSTLPMAPNPNKSRTLLMSLSTVIGVIIAFLWKGIPLWFEFSLIGLATGVLLYTVIRHHIPFGRKGRISYFTAGFVLYSLFIILTWYV